MGPECAQRSREEFSDKNFPKIKKEEKNAIPFYAEPILTYN